MAYRHDLFVSYKRETETRQWIADHFQPLLAHSVGLELGRPPEIYRDDRLEAGGTWPVDLGLALGSSRVLIALWTKTYFHSVWCARELSVMLGRERDEGFRTPAQQSGLVIPVVLHDCEKPPTGLEHVTYTPISAYFNVRMRRDSLRAEQLADAIAALAPGVARAIQDAPPWQAQWPQATAEQFLAAVLKPGPPQQTTVPGYAA